MSEQESGRMSNQAGVTESKPMGSGGVVVWVWVWVCNVWRGLVAKVPDDRLSGQGKYESVSVSRALAMDPRYRGMSEATRWGEQQKRIDDERRVFKRSGVTDWDRIYSIGECAKLFIV